MAKYNDARVYIDRGDGRYEDMIPDLAILRSVLLVYEPGQHDQLAREMMARKHSAQELKLIHISGALVAGTLMLLALAGFIVMASSPTLPTP